MASTSLRVRILRLLRSLRETKSNHPGGQHGRSVVPFCAFRDFCVRSLAVNPATQAFPPSHLGNSNEFDCARFGVGWLIQHCFSLRTAT